LFETLVNKKIIFLMHGTVTSLACALPNFETSSEGGRIIGVPGNFGRPVGVTMVHTNGVDLLFVTLDTVRSTNVISIEPGLGWFTALERSSEAI
jgi:hypothetical protein